ncbi:MAG: tetraacyldisaccharide 4'-kinase [Lachnoclostridium sp.]|nr:tetraacyldisaccharide 4'-kinase [Lachnoclostridium sp.]
MARSKILATLLLLPISKIYGAVMAVRNKMFDTGMLKSHSFDVPVIVVGNLAMGGTGKTPHVEYIIESLRQKYHIGVLSRGYKRSTKGFVLAQPQSRPEDIGDESYQIYRKYGPEITVAVCEKRADGIARMLQIDPKISLIVLDDAFQHRYVKPTVSIVLTEYNRPLFRDNLLPYGRLREPHSSLNRADIVVVTKCPDEVKPMDFTLFKEKLKLFPYQRLYFSRFSYGSVVPVFEDAAKSIPNLDWIEPGTWALALTGVANPKPFTRYLRTHKLKVKLCKFDDHHNFTASDMEEIERRFDAITAKEKYIFTTEKDAVRLFNNPYFPHRLKPYIFYIPITVEFISDTDNDFSLGIEKTLRDAKLFGN